MNKFKFLSSAVMAAFFAFGLTSCEKEDFNTKVDTNVDIPSIEIPGVTLPDSYKPGDAVISIQPTVWALIDGNLQNATAASTLTFNDEAMKTYTKTSADGFAAMTVKVVATYVATLGEEEKTLTAETTVEVPALTAGQVAIFTPTLVVSAKSPEQGGDQPGGDEPGGDQPGGDEPSVVVPGADGTDYIYYLGEKTEYTKNTTGYVDIKNDSPYYFYYTSAVFNDVKNPEIDCEWENGHQQGVETLAEKLNVTESKGYTMTVSSGYYVYSKSMTRVHAKVQVDITEYPVYVEKKSRSAETKAGTIKVMDKTFIYDKAEYFDSDGKTHGHGQGHGHGHGHDHGHGGSNAGGGIVNPL